MLEVLIVGGGAAGLSAALLLGRCGRSTLVVDAGEPRNRFSRHLHGFISRDGIAPGEFLQIARDQLAAYPSVVFQVGVVREIHRRQGYFSCFLQHGPTFNARMILFATGIVDDLPNIPDFHAFYGISIHHCPYCDGWEHREKPIAIFGADAASLELAEEMLCWSGQLFFCTHGNALPYAITRRLQILGIPCIKTPITRLEGHHGQIQTIHFADNSRINCQALFFAPSQHQANPLAENLGCTFQDNQLQCDPESQTSVPGVYAAGNTGTGLQLAIVAAAEGAKAAWAINQALHQEKLNILNAHGEDGH